MRLKLGLVERGRAGWLSKNRSDYGNREKEAEWKGWLLELCVLATFTVISERIPTCDNALSWFMVTL